MFNVIQLSTIEKCNLKCDFCPNSYLDRSGGIMLISVYKKILNDLQCIGFRGRFSPYLMNECTIDKRLPMLISLAKAALPRCNIMINTNGTLLTQGLLEELDNAGMTNISVSNYKGTVTGDRYRKLKRSDLKCNVGMKTFARHFIDNTFYNRAGLINVGNRPVTQSRCTKPARQMYVNHLGQAILCCSDYRYKCVMGDVKEASLIDIWNNEKYTYYRNELAKGNRAGLELCKNCNIRKT